MSKLAFLFPGQGAQHVGMGKNLISQCRAAAELFERANAILGIDLLNICLEGPKERLDATDISQPAIFVTSLAALEWLKEREPEYVQSCQKAAGLSLGEYTALVFSDAISFEEGLRVVRLRGEAMQAAAEATPSGMVSVLLLDLPQVEALCEEAGQAGFIRVANKLCPGNTVVSGTKEACAEIVRLCEERGHKSIPLAVAGAFHTHLMKPADSRLADALKSVSIRTPRIPVVSNVDAQCHTEPEEIRKILVRQVLEPVLWEASVQSLLTEGVDQFCEIGPGTVLKGLLKRIDRKKECRSINDASLGS